ncbi:MAG: phosphoribosylglycinamide formyltransferase [Candidatus Omnitrophica bacterium]|nr:phosphoribosylglycinamide formyltransferase [Candidatus Omnitrophota bacterium]
MKNIAVFASGRGTNFKAIAQAIKRGKLKVNLALLVCDNPKAAVLDKAKKLGVKACLIQREGFAQKKDFEDEIIKHLKNNKVELVVMAGFMRMLSPHFVAAYKNRIINIHPALLPSFKGSRAIKDAFDYGAKVSGVTVHFVDEAMDHGPIILQEEVALGESSTLKALEEKIHKVEHKLYPQAIKLITQGRVKLRGRRVIITGR